MHATLWDIIGHHARLHNAATALWQEWIGD